jgi:hypothetical protein
VYENSDRVGVGAGRAKSERLELRRRETGRTVETADKGPRFPRSSSAFKKKEYRMGYYLSSEN